MFLEELAQEEQRPEIRSLARRRAGSRELAEDALQETYLAVSRIRPESIKDLRAYFRQALINEIRKQHSRMTPGLTGDVATTVEMDQQPVSRADDRQSPVEEEAEQRLLAEELLNRLERDRGQLLASIAKRSSDWIKYRCAIIAAAKTIMQLLWTGRVTTQDWNTALRSEYPEWFDQAGIACDAACQRLCRGRRDAKSLLRLVVPEDELKSRVGRA
jgi:Sigma-70 region 2